MWLLLWYVLVSMPHPITQWLETSPKDSFSEGVCREDAIDVGWLVRAVGYSGVVSTGLMLDCAQSDHGICTLWLNGMDCTVCQLVGQVLSRFLAMTTCLCKRGTNAVSTLSRYHTNSCLISAVGLCGI